MDEKYRTVERKALSGDPAALSHLRTLAIQLRKIPEPALHALTGYGCPIAQKVIPRRQWPNSANEAFHILYHEIPHNALRVKDDHIAALIRYRVLVPAYQRMIRRPANDNEQSVAEVLANLDPGFRFQGRSLLEVIQGHLMLAHRLTEEAYYDELCVRSMRDFAQNHISGAFGNFYPTDPLVTEHQRPLTPSNPANLGARASAKEWIAIGR